MAVCALGLADWAIRKNQPIWPAVRPVPGKSKKRSQSLSAALAVDGKRKNEPNFEPSTDFLDRTQADRVVADTLGCAA